MTEYWMPYIPITPEDAVSGPRPWQFERIELRRNEWAETRVINPNQMPPEMNVADLWWRPAR
jgi:hypothetical protein